MEVKQFPPDNSTKGKFNVKNWFLYCLKEAKDKTSQQFLKKYLNFNSSSLLFSGHPDSFDACAKLTSVFTQCDFNLIYKQTPSEKNHLNLFPFVPQTNCDILKVSFFLNAFLKAFNLAIWPDKTHVRRLKVGAKATWEECMELSKLYTFIIKQYPIKTQELLMQSRAFNFYTRDYKKLDFNWLPQITIPGYLLELFDGIYNLRTRKFTPHSDNINMDLVGCSNFWPELTFEGLDNNLKGNQK